MDTQLVGRATNGTSPSSGEWAKHVSLPPGGSAAGEYHASITNEKAPCEDKK